MMATAEGFDLYTCEVCFDNMLDKDPRMSQSLSQFQFELFEDIDQSWCHIMSIMPGDNNSSTQ